MKDIYDNIQIEDLTDDLELIATVVGIDTLRNLMRKLQGAYLYIPKISRLEKFVIRYLQENQDKSLKQVAVELGVSTQYLWKLKRDGKIIEQSNSKSKNHIKNCS